MLLDTKKILLWAAADEFTPNAVRVDSIIGLASLYSGLLSAGYQELFITVRHTLLVSSLPPIHKGPFDRILLAQASSEGLPFLTSNNLLMQYPGSVIHVGT
jgi:hypothetical protein